MFESLKRTDSQESLVQECLYLLHIRQGRRKYFNIEEIAYINPLRPKGIFTINFPSGVIY